MSITSEYKRNPGSPASQLLQPASSCSQPASSCSKTSWSPQHGDISSISATEQLQVSKMYWGGRLSRSSTAPLSRRLSTTYPSPARLLSSPRPAAEEGWGAPQLAHLFLYHTGINFGRPAHICFLPCSLLCEHLSNESVRFLLLAPQPTQEQIGCGLNWNLTSTLAGGTWGC